MKKSFKDLIKGIVATSIAAIAGAHGAEAAPTVSFNDSDLDLDIASVGEAKKDLSYKLMLKINGIIYFELVIMTYLSVYVDQR